MNKTDAEIVKILEYCEGDDGISYCNKCPLYEMDNCVHFMSRKAREIINRLKAENERLNKEVDRLSQCVMYHDGQIADVIKKFAERLTDRICENVNRSLDNPNGNNYYPIDVYNDIDNLVKEMTENEGEE